MRCRATFPLRRNVRPLRNRHTTVSIRSCPQTPSQVVYRPSSHQSASASHLKRHPETANPNGIGTAVSFDPFAIRLGVNPTDRPVTV